jgi:serine/threonine-protein kinase
MQEVYVATDLNFDREVALKVPKHPSAVKRFERSAQVSARVIHANVAKTLDYFSEGGRDYLIEEFIHGRNLQERLDDEFNYLDPHLAAHLFHHLARAIAVCHHVDVFHRDLKPSNIMLSLDPAMAVVKITDFGIAKMAEHEIADKVKDNDSISASRTVLGAIPYMAPEVVRRKKDAALPADIWSAGALLYKLISGDLPFGSGLEAVEIILRCKLPPKPLLFPQRDQFTHLLDDLWGIVTACLREDPSARPDADKLMEMCSRLCYSDAPRQVGVVTRFRHGSGDWGFIRSDMGETFFHSDSYYGPKPEQGTRVSFACSPGQPCPRAFPVLPLKPPSAHEPLVEPT